MVFVVDFNRVDKAGRVPARIPSGDAESIFVGTKVVATDGEGTECRAIIDEIGHNGRFVILAPIGGTFRTDVEAQPSMGSVSPTLR
jgi:hypothetical protein